MRKETAMSLLNETHQLAAFVSLIKKYNSGLSIKENEIEIKLILNYNSSFTCSSSDEV